MKRAEFVIAVAVEMERAREIHTTPYHNFHEAYGVLAEEVAEFFDEVREKEHDPEAILKELIQIAAVCGLAASDLIRKEWES